MLLPLLVSAALADFPQDVKPPEFPVDVRLIRLDVSAVDGVGRPVAGLRAEDFKVTEDGRPVPITYFRAVDAGRMWEAPDQQAPDPADAAAPPSRILLLVDAASFSHGQLLRARESASRYLREGARDGDWVRLVNLATGHAWDGRMPEDRARLSAAASTLEARGPRWAQVGGLMDAIEDRVEGTPSEDGVSEAETSGRFLSMFAQASGLLGTLESLLVQLGAVDGRKAVVLISPGFPSIRGLEERLERVSTLARDAATAIYFVDVAGLDGLAPENGKIVPVFETLWQRSGGAQDLAEATGGYAARLSNTLLPALSRISSEMRTYYVVGYAPTRPDDGHFRSIKVGVNVSGVRARTKKGYLAGEKR